MGRDAFEVGKTEPLAAAHARIDALLDEIAAADTDGVYADRLKLTAFEHGRSIFEASGTERAETCAAALLRYVARKRGYTVGTYSPSEYTVHDYSNIVMRTAQTLLRSKLPFEEALLVRLFTETGDFAAYNVRDFPLKGVLTQLDHLIKQRGGLPGAFEASLKDIGERLAADAARYKTSPVPAIVRDTAARVTNLLAGKRA